MREIKFRAWDVKAQRYQTFAGFDRWGMIQSTKDNTWSATGSDMLLLTDNPEFFIWEQYTGLRDKNGVEIYEGDIMRYVDIDEYGDSRTEKVITETIQPLDVYVNTMTWIPRHGEVLGNVHEHKELLK